MNKELRDAVVEIHETAKLLGIQSVLVGALIMEFTSEIKEGYPAYKKTNDADFAVCVKDWSSFKQLHERLQSKDYAPRTKIEHRLSKGSIIVDLIPYGEGVAKAGIVAWPESQFEMTVIGFDEVCAAVTTKVRDGMPDIPVISVPGFALLKIIAFQERFARKDLKYRNDAEHLNYWLENYAAISESDSRRFDFAEKMGWSDVQVNLLGAGLLGYEAGRLASVEAATRIERFLKESVDPYSPFVDAILRSGHGFLSEEEQKGPLEELLAKLGAFEKGFAVGKSGTSL